MKAIACLVAALFVVLVSTSAAFAQAASDPPASPPPSVPPGIPTVAPPVDPTADPSLPEPPLPDLSPEVAVLMAQARVFEARRALEAAQLALDLAKTDEARARTTRDVAQRDRDEKRQVLTDVATNAYVNGGVDDAAIAPTMAEYLPQQSARLLTSSAIDRDQAQLRDAEARLRSFERKLSDAVSKSAVAQTARAAAQAAADEAVLAVSKAGGVANATDASPTVMGDTVLTADEIVGWYNAQGVVGYAGRVDIATMVGYYLDEGKAEQVRGDVAFAQSIIETGAFTSPLTTHNNFAGIGACDSCATGYDFATPQDGVRAQAQLLHAYADKTLQLSMLANPAVGSNPDRLSVRGCCTTWNKLTGTWATDPNYGPKIMTVYLSMLQYALLQRTQPAPVIQPATPLASLAGP